MKTREEGATLVELMIGMAIGFIVMGFAYSLFIMAYQTDLKSAREIKVTSNLRIAVDVISRELRSVALVTDTSNVNGTDADGDGDFGEDPINGLDDDGDGATDEDVSDEITVINADSNGDDLLDTTDNRKKIYLDGSRRLVFETLDTNNNVISTFRRDFSLWSLKIDCYHYDPAETFVDANNNGQYDAGESFDDDDGDGTCDNGFERHLTTTATDINAFEITIVASSEGRSETSTVLVAPRNLKRR